MKVTPVILAATWIIVGAILLLSWEVHTAQRRITQLEYALAQAHAHADTLEAALARLDAD